MNSLIATSLLFTGQLSNVTDLSNEGLLVALRRHGNGRRQWPLSPRKQTYVHDLNMPVYEFTPQV